jgi:glycosyltransferase involved in cell wall biosynthesis
MKILHVADYLPGLHKIAGGAEFAALRTIEEQVSAGLDIEVATLQLDFTLGKVAWQRHHEMKNLDTFAPKIAYAVKQIYFPFDTLAAADLARVIKISRPDVVHYHNLHFSGLSVVSQARAAGIPSVWSIYDYWLFCPAFTLLTNHNELCLQGHSHRCVDCIGTRRLRALKPVKRLFFRTRSAVFRQPAAAVNKFIVLSGASRDLLVRNGIAVDRIRVVPQYIWKEAAAAKDDSSPVPGRLVYVGWVEHHKGLHVIIRALSLIAKDLPEVHLEVLGLPANPGYQKHVEQLARDNGIGDRVHFHGKLARSDLLRELRRAYLITIPEQWENMSPVILTEAMAAGACVLASRVGGIPEFVEEFRSGLLADRDNPAEFAERIRWAMAHPTEVRNMASAARERARKLFNPQSVTTSMIDLYQSLIDVRP